ncbi:hypothetical protein, partial [Parabacteroides johnsonii]
PLGQTRSGFFMGNTLRSCTSKLNLQPYLQQQTYLIGMDVLAIYIYVFQLNPNLTWLSVFYRSI